jgi:hypothetical protein
VQAKGSREFFNGYLYLSHMYGGKAEEAEKDRWRTEAEAQQTQRRVSRCAYRIWRVRLMFLAILAAGRCFKERKAFRFQNLLSNSTI